MRHVLASEPAALAALPEVEAAVAGMTAPAEAHLAASPGDHRGAAVLLLSATAGAPLDPDDPALQPTLAHAEAMVRDDAALVTRRRFGPEELSGAAVTIAVGAGAAPFLRAVADELGRLAGRPVVVSAEARSHEPYLDQPEVLTSLVTSL